MKIAFLVPESSTKPYCSVLISGLMDLLALCIITRRSIFITWLIILKVRCNSHSIAPGFLGKAINTDFRNAAGPDKIVVEMIEALEDFGIQRLTPIGNIIYDTGEIPEALLKSVFIALPKKPGAIECELLHLINCGSYLSLEYFWSFHVLPYF